jgi:hypothetical protein
MENLPEENQKVIVVLKNGKEFDAVYRNGNFYAFNKHRCTKSVIVWRPK